MIFLILHARIFNSHFDYTDCRNMLVGRCSYTTGFILKD